jgi:hypothetical protein
MKTDKMLKLKQTTFGVRVHRLLKENSNQTKNSHLIN